MTIIEFLNAHYDAEENAARIAADIPEAPMNVTRWHPAHVLLDLASKRAIMGLHTCPCPDPGCTDCDACSGYHHADPTPAPCETMRTLALPYADREGYVEEWRP